MYGVSKISSEQNIMLTTFPGAQYSAQSLAEHLDVFAKAGIIDHNTGPVSYTHLTLPTSITV